MTSHLSNFPETLEGNFSLFLPQRGYFVTPLILLLNLLVFLAMVIGGVHFFTPTAESLLGWGANFAPLTLNGQWWRLLTGCFVHFGIIHLAMNMYALLSIGSRLELELGSFRFALAYLLAGLGGSVASLWWHEEIRVSAGASGAIFGLYGLFLAMLLLGDVSSRDYRRGLFISTALFVGYNLLFGLAVSFIDNAGHVGGLLAGLLVGFCFQISLRKPASYPLYLLSSALAPILLVGCCWLVVKRIPNYYPILIPGNPQAAISAYTEKIRQYPQRAQLYELRGNAYLEKREFPQAVTDYEKALRLGKSSDQLLYNLALCQASTGDFTGAVKQLNAAIRLNNTKPVFYNLRGWARSRLGDDFEALADYEQATELDTTFGPAYNNMGLVRERQGEITLAKKHYRKAIQCSNAWDYPHLNLGKIISQEGDMAGAEREFSQAIAVNQKNSEAFYLRALTRLNLSMDQEAIRDLDRAIALNPKNPQYYYERALASHQMPGKRQSALRDMDSTLALAPGYYFSYLGRAQMYLDWKEYALAEQDYRKVILLRPDESSAYGNLGWLKYLMGDYQACLRYSLRAVELDSTAMYAKYNIALTELCLGHFERARRIYLSCKQADLKDDQQIRPGAIEDLKDLVKRDIHTKEARIMLEEVLEVE